MTKTSYSSKVTGSQGVAVAQGTKSRASSKVKNASALNGIDNEALLKELPALRQGMKSEGTDVDHDIALSAVASAEKAAREGDKSGVVSNLKKAGSWALGIAQKLALSAAEDAIKQSLDS